MREMKNSGTEWLSDIPRNWTLSNIGSLYTMRNVKVSDQDYPPLSVTMKGVVPQLETAAKTDAHDDRKLVKKGDFAINSRSDRRGSCGIADRDGSVSLINTILAPRTEMNPNYYNWLFHSSSFADEFYRWGHGIVDDLWTTRWQEMKKIDVPVPTYEEQEQIASKLETECTKVDALIANQEAQIEKLKAYKQSLITEVVTKGLDPDVPMKDSGVEWIGNIAANHSVWKLKFMLSEQMMYGANESGESRSEHSARYIRITDITADNSLKDDENNLYLANDKAEPYILSDKDILFARSGGTVGKSFMYREEYGRSAFAGYLIKAKCNQKKLIPEYLLYYTQSSLYEIWKNMIFIQATIQNIGANKYSNMEMVVMPIAEQKEIVEYLDDKCAKVDVLIAIKQRKIEKLNQYKKSLIYEYVTGKKEVM